MGKIVFSSTIVLFILLPITNIQAVVDDPLETAVSTRLELQQEAITSQQNIDALASQTEKATRKYRQAIEKTESLNAYNKQLRKLIKQQQNDLASVQRQLDNVDETQRDILPLMLKMIETLDKFIKLDLPFLQIERQQRITLLKEIMERPDVSLPDKYRRIMEAYQIEVEYGRTIESYTEAITIDEGEHTVSILRVGRLLLTFQTIDGEKTGVWDQQSKTWKKLSGDYDRSISKGLKVAKKQAPPELIKLPINVVEE